MKATVFIKDEPCATSVPSNVGGEAFCNRHNRTVVSRDAEMTVERFGNTTPRT
jgi:hypothetical protein